MEFSCGGQSTWVSHEEEQENERDLGLRTEDLQCPICVQTLQDAFVTGCGHTFCYACITTHLKHKSNCPSCAAFLTVEGLYPNFLLNKASGWGRVWAMGVGAAPMRSTR